MAADVAPTCAYCSGRILKRQQKNAKARGRAPRFCAKAGHRAMYFQRRARFTAKGLAGDELAAALDQAAKETPSRVRKARPKADEPQAILEPETPAQSPVAPTKVPLGTVLPNVASVLAELDRLIEGGK